MIATGLLVLWVAFGANRFWLGQITSGLAFALIFLSFVIITGLGGMVSLAQAAFVSAAALAAGLMVDHYHAPYLVGVLVGWPWPPCWVSWWRSRPSAWADVLGFGHLGPRLLGRQRLVSVELVRQRL